MTGCVTTGDVAALAIRTGLGATLFAHGTQKLFGWFGGGGLDAAANGFHGMGYRPARPMAAVAGLCEAAGGAALVAGLGTPAGGAAVAGAMGVAAETHAPNGFFNADGGLEYPALIALGAAALVAQGPGRLSLDEATGHVFDRPWMRLAALAAVPAAVGAVVARKHRSLAEDAAEPEGAESASG
ncbi:DoxX family membrane protein [Streptomonospora wellingtoniae]|uniref:DoxX family membrane protein n=1 Tax=Streptomonospora wellingtoniae TaxID=3075544 RepID=A0ABU2KV49_9ACTN|nr:DoxX family membrane protein [Streptomonospora sp. DSM 45055]MDT0303166.1 DoxX family membrane protein [Streptomonospora sp. DSM 45055]